MILHFFPVFETRFLCVALEPVLELALEDQAGLQLTDTYLCLLSAGIKAVHHHHMAENTFLFIN